MLYLKYHKLLKDLQAIKSNKHLKIHQVMVYHKPRKILPMIMVYLKRHPKVMVYPKLQPKVMVFPKLHPKVMVYLKLHPPMRCPIPHPKMR